MLQPLHLLTCSFRFMARKARVVVLIGEVLVPDFDRMKPSVGLVIEFY